MAMTRSNDRTRWRFDPVGSIFFPGFAVIIVAVALHSVAATAVVGALVCLVSWSTAASYIEVSPQAMTLYYSPLRLFARRIPIGDIAITKSWRTLTIRSRAADLRFWPWRSTRFTTDDFFFTASLCDLVRSMGYKIDDP